MMTHHLDITGVVLHCLSDINLEIQISPTLYSKFLLQHLYHAKMFSKYQLRLRFISSAYFSTYTLKFLKLYPCL